MKKFFIGAIIFFSSLGLILLYEYFKNQKGAVFVCVYCILMFNLFFNFIRAMRTNKYVMILRSQPGFSFESQRKYAWFWFTSDCIIMISVFVASMMKMTSLT